MGGPQTERKTGESAASLPSFSKKGNFLVIGALVGIVLLYFSWQVRHSTRIFLAHARQQSRMLADVIRLNAEHSLLSRRLLEKTVQRFLANSVQFIAYLDDVEPFTGGELTAFAQEAGLAGITIISGDPAPEERSRVEGPSGWLAGEAPPPGVLVHRPDSHLYLLSKHDPDTDRTIVIGFDATYMEQLESQTGLPRLLAALGRMPGIRRVEIEPGDGQGMADPGRQQLQVETNADAKTVAVRLPLGRGRLLVSLDASHYFARVRQLWREFFVFSLGIVGLGLFFSWLLSRYQQAYIAQLRRIDQQMAKQREEAALGRAAATLSHEIKNPLNAINMGLQRLQFEADNLPDEHRHLLVSMQQAVQRTNRIVTDLLRYASPIVPRKKRFVLTDIVSSTLELYRQVCRQQNITVEYDDGCRPTVDGDADLLGQAFENLCKNAVEAQPHGGFLRLAVACTDNEALVTLENGGLASDIEDLRVLLEPYVTTKARGSGLGLAIARQIITAHEGDLRLSSPAPGVLRTVVVLPLADAGQTAAL